MAIVHRKENDLKRKIKEIQKIYYIYIISLIITIVLYYPAGIVVGIVFNLIYRKKFIEMKKYKKGLVGEEKTLALLESLDDSYHIFNDLNIVYDNKNSQLDIVVVGDNGITIVESKNINGVIKGHIDDHDLKIKKTGRRGGIYYKSMYNPYKQVKTHVYRLSNYLKENKANVWASGVVFFQPKKGLIFKKSISVKGSENIFFYKGEDLIDYILNKKDLINPEMKNHIVNNLLGQVKWKEDNQDV